ncbi:GerMN domain-containing protein [Paenibacillus sp. PL2-23]|uniref:GerMN domain-containing protein n=1 Tax=Paenibacillus sp. PL2-23 TaxID=2100729 RepID=UPI0030FCE26D
MIQKKWIRRSAYVALLALPVITAGCGLFSQQTSKTIDPPQVEETGDMNSDPTGQALPDGQEPSRMTVYLQDSNGYLAPIAVPVTLGEKETAAQKALEVMVDNGAYAALIPEDFRAMIPQGTQVIGYTYDQERKVAKVNLSGAFLDYNAQDERDIVESITWTLTAMPGIEGVELSVEGQLLEEMPQAAFPIQGELTRKIGINLERAEGVNPANSSSVVLYFSAQSLNHEEYYVPVTRLIDRSDSKEHAAMEQLIQGPLDAKKLTSVILPNVEVESLELLDEGLVKIDLKDEAYESGLPVPAEMLQAIVLSLTENTGATSVQISINGETDLVDDANNTYSETQPATRPHHLNALKS